MISTQIDPRKDGKSSPNDSYKYGEGFAIDKETDKLLHKSHRTRLIGFGLVENAVYVGQGTEVMSKVLALSAAETKANCDLNTKVRETKKQAHFVISFGQQRPDEAALRDIEDTTLFKLKLDKNHCVTFLHNDNGKWHIHLFVSRIDKKNHRCNSLWHDRILRDEACREVELRHGLIRDSGFHEITVDGKIIEIPRAERIARRKEKQDEKGIVSISSKKVEIHTGEKSFQSWCNEIRIGDRLKHSKSWSELHEAAFEYNCQIKPRGAGYVISPINQKGGIQLSAIGLKNLHGRLGKFESANFGSDKRQKNPVQEYIPEPTLPANTLFEKWMKDCASHKVSKSNLLAEFRKSVSEMRFEIRNQQKNELAEIRLMLTGGNRKFASVIVKMRHAATLTKFFEETRINRSTLYKELSSTEPGRTFRAYLLQQARVGNEEALVFVRQYGVDEATTVSRQSEVMQLKIVATLAGFKDNPVPTIKIKYQVVSNGTVIFDLGEGRIVTDSAISNQIQLNQAAACDQEAIETSLRFAVSRFGNTLKLTGTDEFKRLAVETAVRRGLFITFTDPSLEQYKKEFSEKIFSSHKTKEKPNVRNAEKNTNQGKSSPDGRDHLYPLSERDLVSESASNQMLLQSDVQNDLAERVRERIQGQRSGLRQSGIERTDAGRDSTNTPSATREPNLDIVLANNVSKVER